MPLSSCVLSIDVLNGSVMTANEFESTWCTDNDCGVMTTARTDGTALRPHPVHDSPLLLTCSDGRRARMRETSDAVCRTNDSGKCSADMRRRHIGYTAQQQIHLSPRAELVMMATRHHGLSSTTRAVCQQHLQKSSAIGRCSLLQLSQSQVCSCNLRADTPQHTSQRDQMAPSLQQHSNHRFQTATGSA